MNPDIQHHELAAMRAAANKMPFDAQQKFNALLDAYEDLEGFDEKLGEAEEKFKDLEDAVETATKTLRDAVPSLTPREKREAREYGEFVSEETWQEQLAEFDPPEDPEDGQSWEPPSAHELAELKAKRDALIATELNRARAAEEKLRARVEALEDAVEAALEELE